MSTALINIAFGFGTSLAWFVFFWGLNGTLQVGLVAPVTSAAPRTPAWLGLVVLLVVDQGDCSNQMAQPLCSQHTSCPLLPAGWPTSLCPDFAAVSPLAAAVLLAAIRREWVGRAALAS